MDRKKSRLVSTILSVLLVAQQTDAQSLRSFLNATASLAAVNSAGAGQQQPAAVASPLAAGATAPAPWLGPTRPPTAAAPAPASTTPTQASNNSQDAAVDVFQGAVDKWRLTLAEAAAIGHPHMAGKMSICISPYVPDVYCDPDKPPSTYTGYGVSIFEQLAKRVPWLRDARAWEYRCVEKWSEMEADLSSVGGRGCMLGLMMNPSRDEAWIASRAINQEGLQILTRMKRNTSPKDLFSPFAAFTWQLWLMLFGTAFAVAIVLWVFDVIAKSLCSEDGKEEESEEEEDEDGDKVKRSKSEMLPRHKEDPETGETTKGAEGCDATKGADKEAGKKSPGRRLLHAMGVKPGGEDKALKRLDENLRNAALHLARAGKPPFGVTLPAQVVLWAWGLTSMICLSLYTGATAALMTTSSLTGGIHDRNDLVGKAVGTWGDYVDRLREAGIPAVAYKWETDEDEAVMLEDLRRGKVAALVLDYNFVQFKDGHDCDFASVGDSFLLNDIGISINKAVPQNMIHALNDAIMTLVESGDMEELRDIHVKGLGGKCSAANFRVQKSTAVRVSQVLGLWVVLGLATLAGAVLLCFLYVTKKKRAAATHALVQVARTVSKPFMAPRNGRDTLKATV